jgi:uncharacterized membrane protein YvbJ
MLTHRQPETDKQMGIQAGTRQAASRQPCTQTGTHAQDGETLARKQPARQAGKNRICCLKQFRMKVSVGDVIIIRIPFGCKTTTFSVRDVPFRDPR